MNKELGAMIKVLEQRNVVEEAYVNFSYNHGDPDDEWSIVANQQGLELYALEFLKASNQFSFRKFAEDNREVFKINRACMSKSNELYFQYIELKQESRSEIESKVVTYKKTWKNRFMNYVAGAVLIFILLSIIVGAITVIGWVIGMFL